jgi:hypothetical protein
MKVMCIDTNSSFHDGTEPKYLEVVTASQCDTYPDNYDLLEYPKDKAGNTQSFQKKRFIPLSDIDETQMQHNYQPETQSA